LIKYEIPQAGPVSLKIYNLAGQEILEMVNAVQQPGRYQINWNGQDSRGKLAPSGVYIYKLLVNGFEETRKMTLMKF
jgi:flagellar hook assembly protein FlgD